ncbi:MAG: slipin family protein [Planctomycetes bacterium]|nr:slipin family protein [Planctomycetota bacterium]
MQRVTIQEFEKGVLFRKGRLIGVLGPGEYRIWKLWHRERLEKLDLRIRTLVIGGQEMMTSDKVTLRLNALVKYRIEDATAAVVRVEKWAEQLYADAQLALRGELAAQTLDELLAAKGTLGARARELLAPIAAEYGVRILDLGLKDVILPGEMKSILNQVIEARKRAEAAVIERREEVSAIRSQVNTADLYAKNPTLMRLKELEALQGILGGPGRTFVLGAAQDLLGNFLGRVAPGARPGGNGGPADTSGGG